MIEGLVGENMNGFGFESFGGVGGVIDDVTEIAAGVTFETGGGVERRIGFVADGNFGVSGRDFGNADSAKDAIECDGGGVEELESRIEVTYRGHALFHSGKLKLNSALRIVKNLLDCLFWFV